jgi:hypothetical protein
MIEDIEDQIFTDVLNLYLLADMVITNAFECGKGINYDGEG